MFLRKCASGNYWPTWVSWVKIKRDERFGILRTNSYPQLRFGLRSDPHPRIRALPEYLEIYTSLEKVPATWPWTSIDIS